MDQFRHGDLLIERIEALGPGKTTGDNLLARGEGRNHGHFIESDEMEIIASNDEQTTHFLDLKKEGKLKHLLIDSKQWTGEHHDITLPPGTYRVIRQREYDPYQKAIRIIKD